MTATRVYLETFGCQMNELDSELVAEMLRSHGYEFTSDRNAADVVVYNTCSVREQAENKVYSRIGEIGRLKRRGRSMILAVVGCMAERDGENMMSRMPQVDVLCGPGELDKLPMLLDNAVGTAGVHRRDRRHVTVALQGDNSRRTATLGAAEDRLEALDLSRSFDPDFRAGSANSAYVRITRGCNKFCTYCVVPFTRGAEIHRPPDHIVDECKKLADAGVIEVTLLGQTVNHYRYEHGAAITIGGVAQPQKGRSYSGGHGRDPLHGANTTTFADLLHRIHEQVPTIARLRFVTSYPRDFGDDVLQVMRDSPRICRYLHLPVQSGSDRILKLMNRGYTAGEYLDLIDRVKSYLPDIMLAGDFIVGFPTESDADFQATVDLLRTVRYKSSFIFKYSPRPGTMAINKIPDDVPLSVKRARNAALLDVQAEISDAVANEQIGKTMDVLVEGASKRTRKARGDDRNGGVTLTVEGRTRDQRSDGDESSDAAVQLSGRSDGDLIVIFDGDEALQGTIVPARITGARMLTLFGTLEAP